MGSGAACESGSADYKMCGLMILHCIKFELIKQNQYLNIKNVGLSPCFRNEILMN